MNKEQRRQFVHISGFIFILLAGTTGGLIISFYSFIIAFFFLIYSFYLNQQKKRINSMLRKLESLETKFRDFTMNFARSEEIETKFLHGPFWFFLGFGITFLLFPLPIASAACAVLAVGDAFSNIIGSRFGRRKIRKNRTIEGSFAFFITSFFASLLFVSPVTALAGSFFGMIAEIFGRHNDNITIPLAAAVSMYAVFLFFGTGNPGLILMCTG